MNSERITIVMSVRIFQKIADDASFNRCDINQYVAHVLQEFIEDSTQGEDFFIKEIERLKKIQSDFVAGKWWM